MLLFASDIDNTLIYSHKHELNTEKIPCELYNGKNISFITKYTQEKLDYIYNNSLFIPVTTRSIEQYKRIRFNKWQPKYAITSNGGCLLINGEKSKEWSEFYLNYISDKVDILKNAVKILEDDKYRDFDVKWVDDLFIYTKSTNPEYTAASLSKYLKGSDVLVYSYSSKVYAVPANLNKGYALKKFIKDYKLNPSYIVTAGDSSFDIPLLEAGTYALFPETLNYSPVSKKYQKISQNQLFSDKVVENVIQLI